MKFLDKAKEKLGELSDEVVRVMDTDEKKKGSKRSKNDDKRSKKSSMGESFMKKRKVDTDEPIIETSKHDDSVFDLEDGFEDSFYQEKQEQYEKLKAEYDAIDAPEVEGNGRIQDILDFYQINKNVEIPSNVLMYDDFDDLTFNHQAPIGYDFGEVDFFREQARESVKVYQELLKGRNSDIAKIASAIDKLQVDLNNTKYELQVANGLSIMPANETAELESALVNEKIKNKKLLKQIELLENMGAEQQNSEETESFINSLQDELALLRRENEELATNNEELIRRLDYLEENQDNVSAEDTPEDNYFNMDEENQDDGFIETVMPADRGEYVLPDNTSFVDESFPEDESFSDEGFPNLDNDTDAFSSEENFDNSYDNSFSESDENFGFTEDDNVEMLDDNTFEEDETLEETTSENKPTSETQFYLEEDNDDILDNLMSSWE